MCKLCHLIVNFFKLLKINSTHVAYTIQPAYIWDQEENCWIQNFNEEIWKKLLKNLQMNIKFGSVGSTTECRIIRITGMNWMNPISTPPVIKSKPKQESTMNDVILSGEYESKSILFNNFESEDSIQWIKIMTN